jgi:hypothetical protein
MLKGQQGWWITLAQLLPDSNYRHKIIFKTKKENFNILTMFEDYLH